MSWDFSPYLLMNRQPAESYKVPVGLGMGAVEWDCLELTLPVTRLACRHPVEKADQEPFWGGKWSASPLRTQVMP